MPFFEADGRTLARVPSGTPPPYTPPPPILSETVEASARRVNAPRGLFDYLTRRPEVTLDPNHNPLDIIGGTRFESDYSHRFTGSPNEAGTRYTMRKIEQEERDREVSAASGIVGMVVDVGMGLLDPTIFMPGGALIRAGRTGATIARGALSVGAAGAAQAAVQESILYGTQETRTGEEVALNIGAATILSGLIGGGAAALLSRGERQAMERLLADDRQQWAADISGVPASAGAAAADTRRVELRPSGLNRVFDLPGARSVAEGPTTQVFMSGFVSGKRTMATLAESPLQMQEHLAGIPTAPGGALSRRMQQIQDQANVQIADTLDETYRRYRFGVGETNVMGRTRRALIGFGAPPAGKLSFADFKAQVDWALIHRDEHEIPEVAEAARVVRSLTDPWVQRAVDAGFFDEIPETKTAASWSMRDWNTEKIRTDGPALHRIIVDWLSSENASKIAAREKLAGLSDELEAAERRIAELEGKQEAWTAADELAITNAHGDVDRLTRSIEAELKAWRGKSASDAVAALNARDKADAVTAERRPGSVPAAARLARPSKEISRATKRITEGWQEMSPAEIKTRASEIIDRILGGPVGRLPYDAPKGGPRIGVPDEVGRRRGSLAAREFMIPDELVWDFLEHDIEFKMQKYFRTFIPDVLIAEQFGDVEMTLAFKQLAEEKAARLADPALTGKQRKAINDEADRVAASIAGVRDRMRNTYGWTGDNFARNMGRVAAAVNNASTLTDMGGVTLSSLNDMAGTVFRWGFGAAFRGAWLPYLKHLTAIDGRKGEYAQAKRQFRALGIAAETITSARKNAWGDILVNSRPQNRFEKTLQVASDKYFLVNFLAPWTDWQKTMAGMVASSEIVRASKAVSEGRASRKQITRLAESGFDQAGAERLWQEFNRPGGGNTFGGSVYLANTEAWTSARTRETFEAALGREADIMVVTPGQEKPLWLSKPLGSVLGRFKSFVAAANERMLIANLQQHDFATLQGLVFSVALGMVAESAYSVVTGRPTPKTPSDWVKQGMSRAGVLGWFEEGNALSAKMTRGSLDIYRLIGSDKPLSRYQSRTFLSSLLGPTAGKVENIGLITGAIGAGEWSAADTTRVRRLIAGQNLLYLRGLFDQVEEAVNGFMGVPPKEPVD